MGPPDVYIAESFLEEYDNERDAVVTLVIAFAVAKIVDRALGRRARQVTERVAGRALSPVAHTRLRLVRRLVFVVIIVIGIGLALSKLPALNRVATGLLASSAVLGLVVGFAARQTLANAIAGILLAISQPIRVGDLVTFEDETGEVEDVRLSYTYIRCDDGRRLVIPNEKLAQSPVENHTLVDPRVKVEVSFWLPSSVDVQRALQLLTEEPDVEAHLAEVDKDGLRLTATTWVDKARERGAAATRLREKGMRRLQGEGLFSEVAS